MKTATVTKFIYETILEQIMFQTLCSVCNVHHIQIHGALDAAPLSHKDKPILFFNKLHVACYNTQPLASLTRVDSRPIQRGMYSNVCLWCPLLPAPTCLSPLLNTICYTYSSDACPDHFQPSIPLFSCDILHFLHPPRMSNRRGWNTLPRDSGLEENWIWQR
jgi:hypothetical protein